MAEKVIIRARINPNIGSYPEEFGCIVSCSATNSSTYGLNSQWQMLEYLSGEPLFFQFQCGDADNRFHTAFMPSDCRLEFGIRQVNDGWLLIINQEPFAYYINGDGRCLSFPENPPVSCITRLWIDCVNSMSDFSEQYAGWSEISEISFAFCQELRSLSGLVSFSNLLGLECSHCYELSDLTSLTDLYQLEALNLYECGRITDLSPLGKHINLVALNLGRSYRSSKITDITRLSQLTALQYLNLEFSDMADINPLACLKELKSLILNSCQCLTDVSALSSLTKLESVELSCTPVCDGYPLSMIPELRQLDLSCCFDIEDFSFLNECRKLEQLKLNDVSAVENLDIIAECRQLHSLSLNDCVNIVNLDPLRNLTNLQVVSLRDCLRIKSLFPLRELINLQRVDVAYHPGIVAELLAHTAVLRKDISFISTNAHEWLKEGDGFDGDSLLDQECLATTLGEAFSLLGDHPILSEYEAFLDSHPEFSAEPWKAWLIGTYKQSGYEFYRQRVDRLSLSACAPGTIGGVCASLPYGDAEEDQKKWSLSWLLQMEQARSSEFHELLSIAPEICLAYARLDYRDGLERWLLRFTDPSDPGGLDAVQSALGKWQLEQGNATQAFGHAVRILSPLLRDALLADIARSCVESDPAMTAEIVLVIELSDIRRGLAAELASNSAFVKNPAHVHALIASSGDSREQLSNIVSALSKTADSTIIYELSVLMAATESDRCDWVLARFKQLEADITRRLKSRLIENG